MRLENTTWQGEPALLFEAGGYEALMIPGVGANVVKLVQLEKEVDILSTPENIDTFKARPQVYGLPLLFPPNRIEDGTYTALGKTYNFPINDVANNNHSHGFIRTLPFMVTKAEKLENEDAIEIETSFISNDKNDSIYKYFDHEFECRLSYRLSKDGLLQKVTFINNSTLPMPLGVGFHTAFKVPFHKESNKEDYRLLISADKRWELSSRNLPTGNLLPLNESEKNYRKDGMMPFAYPLDAAYTAKPLSIDGKPYHGAILVDTAQDIKVFYEVGPEYKHWTIWNNQANVNYLCPEPQTWAINAPNLDLPDEITGFKLLPPGESWSENCKIYVK